MCGFLAQLVVVIVPLGGSCEFLPIRAGQVPRRSENPALSAYKQRRAQTQKPNIQLGLCHTVFALFMKGRVTGTKKRAPLAAGFLPK